MTPAEAADALEAVVAHHKHTEGTGKPSEEAMRQALTRTVPARTT
jgi:hypothetical protein